MKRRLAILALVAYAALLAVSYVVRSRQAEPRVPDDMRAVEVRAVKGEQTLDRTVRLAYKDYLPETTSTSLSLPTDANAQQPDGAKALQPADATKTTPVVLLQGSPGSHRDFARFAPRLAATRRVIVPDLPGFGASSHDVHDYSVRAHARYVLELLDALGVERAHVVGFSMGGGVALNMADLAPSRVASITMLSAIGVQELELLGDYHLNHALHGAQLAALWLLREGTPHMGVVHSDLNVEYARNFYDTDQRPLRGVLERYRGPMLVVHGDEDVMVPVEAAREHARIVPQSELRLMPGENHFYLFGGGEEQARSVSDFLNRVERGEARTRDTAEPARVERAAQAFDAASSVPKARGVTALVLVALLALSTLVSEDLTCIGAGVMAAQGRVSFALAAFACLLGIYVGDLLLFLAGRYLGRPALRRAPLKWLVRAEDVERSSRWFRRRGMAVIALSRFLPGTRLPTYVAAGLLDTSFWKFSFYFFIAAAVWTPALVGLSMFLGANVIESALMAGQGALVKVLLTAVLVLFVVRLFVKLLSWRGRRLLFGRWRRLRRWEFWPPWVFYPPVLLYVAWLGIRHRGLTLFTCANPGVPAGGGFIGESKIEILRRLSANEESRPFVARAECLDGALTAEERARLALEFMAGQGLDFPAVLKPDAGQRGAGVKVVRDADELREYLRGAGGDTIIQEYAPGAEFGVFYCRFPGDERGRIFSITDKQFPAVRGDGKATLEELILRDGRAVAMARAYFEAQRARLWDTPAEGEEVRLVEIGTHCRGSLFLDGGWVSTDALTGAVDRLARGFEGFYFGRFDIRTPSVPDFQRGENFKVVELNGVTSEATHIYDPRNGLFDAYRVLFEQWRIAFEIGAQNRARGARPASVRELARALFGQWFGRRRGARRQAAAREDGKRADGNAECTSQV